MKRKYFCEKCNAQFDEPTECYAHEEKCFNKAEKLTKDFENALTVLSSQLKIKIINKDIQLLEYVSEEYNGSRTVINLSGALRTGKPFNICIDKLGIPSFEDIVNDITENIHKYDIKEYEGILENGYGDQYILGNESVSDICSRLVGKKVKIQVIEN
jgi:hypothetical protein